jgi:hypothetical protein
MFLKIAGFLFVFACLGRFAQADLIMGSWTFETSPPANVTGSTIGGIVADVGTGTASGFHASAATVWSTPTGNGSIESLSSNTWAIGDYYQFETSTIGSGAIGLTLSWDQTSSTTGPGVFDLEYRVGNSDPFTVFLNDYTVLPNSAPPTGLGTWNNATPISGHSFFQDLSSVPGLLEQSLVQFRLTVATDADATPPGTIAAAGASRVDNFTISAIPEPSSLLLFGCSAIAMNRVRRRSRK